MSKYFIRFSLLFFTLHSTAQTKLPKIFSDHMVLQREADIPIWGFATPGAQVTVSIYGNSQSCLTDQNGEWSLRLGQMKAGGPYELKVYENNSETPAITYKDVLIGDVWFAGGQSNMEWPVQSTLNADEEIKTANHPEIRFINVPQAKSSTPQSDIKNTSWKVCTSESVKNTSAVAYFFARKIHLEENVPIVIIQSYWGGTPVEAWTSREAMLSSSITHDQILQNDTIKENHFIQDSLDLIR